MKPIFFFVVVILFVDLFQPIRCSELKCATTVAVIICKGDSSTKLSPNLGKGHQATLSLEDKLNRQIRQTIVLIRSIAITQRYGGQHSILNNFWTKERRIRESCVNFIIIGKDPKILQEIQQEISFQNWDADLLSMVHISFVEATYPKRFKRMEHVYRQCATLRLFLPEILPNVSKLIYVDTDIIFLRPPSILYSTFDYFSPTQLAGISPDLIAGNKMVDGLYNPQTYNTGVMLMHLERMRNSKWTNKVAMVAELRLKKAVYGDQDVLIVYFKFNADEIYHLACHWNYLPKYCKVDCGQSTGISVLHGLVESFFMPLGSPFEVLYRYYHDYDMKNFSIHGFNRGLGDRLWNRKKDSLNPQCKNFCARHPTNIDGKIPTFTSAVMKTMSDLEANTEPSSLRKTVAEDLSHQKFYMPNAIQAKQIPLRSGSKLPADIILAVTFVESKVYNQIELLTTMLKSLVATSSSTRKQLKTTVVILTDQQKSCTTIKEKITGWNTNKMTLNIECIVANYIKGFHWMADVFKPGVFFRLFYPQLISYDAVIHVDTDIIFNHDVGDLWAEFKNFRKQNIIAAAPQLSVSKATKEKFPTTAYQAGIMLMNLTKMREIGWAKKLTMIAQILKPYFRKTDKILPVQTILHTYFKFHRKEIKKLNVYWNFLPHYCNDYIFRKLSNRYPIYAIHGVNNSFTRRDTMEPLYKQIYLTYMNLNLTLATLPKHNVIKTYDILSPCSQSTKFLSRWYNYSA